MLHLIPVKCFGSRCLLCSPRLHLFDKKYSGN